MDESEVKPFDDPALKAAVQRAWPVERAPLDLALRCQAAMREAVPLPGDSPRSLNTTAAWRIPHWATYAAAAVVLLVVGISLLVVDKSDPIRPGEGFAAANVLPASYLAGLVKRHDDCRDRYGGRHHHLNCDQDDFAQIESQLESQLDNAVLVIDPRPEGWKFDGAAMCPLPVDQGGQIRNLPASHLLFERDGRQTLSVISVEFRGRRGAKPGETFVDDAGQNHLVAGFVDNDELHCLVGHSTDGSLTREDLRRMGDKYQIAVQVIRLPHNLLVGPTAYVR